MDVDIRRALRNARIITMIVALWMMPTPADAGEFKIGRYIEPNQMSNLFTKHVRKGIVKRVGLTKTQLHQIREVIDPYRESLLVQITEIKESRIDLFEAVAGNPLDRERIRSTHRDAMSKELDLMMTVGLVLRDIRPILTEEQLREIAEMVEEVRAASDLRFEDFSSKLAAGEMLGLEARPESANGTRD